MIGMKYLMKCEENKVWGTDFYTDNSDLISGNLKFLTKVCLHLGLFDYEEILKNQQMIKGIIVNVKIGEEKNFTSSYRNKVRSRSWTNHDGNSITIESFKMVKDNTFKDTLTKKPKTIPPQTNSELENERFLPNVTIVYNLSSEPSYKYHLNLVADQGYDESKFTSARLVNEVLFVEDESQRYQISYEKPHFNLSKVYPLPNEELEKTSLPLSGENCEKIENGLDWKDFIWSPKSLKVKGKEYFLKNFKFLKIKKDEMK